MSNKRARINNQGGFIMIIAKARAVDGPDKPFRLAEIKRHDLDSHDVLK